MDLTEIKARLQAAHVGNWRVVPEGTKIFRNCGTPGKLAIGLAHDDCIVGEYNEEVMGCTDLLQVRSADLEFMAHAKQDIAELVTEVERLQKITCAAGYCLQRCD